MTKKDLICIECPKGCGLKVDIENCRAVRVEGGKCPKGEKYAVSEIENPMRVLTSAIIAKGLEIKMAPVRTDKPIPKSRIMEAMDRVKAIALTRPLKAGDIIEANFLGLDVNLIATRDVRK